MAPEEAGLAVAFGLRFVVRPAPRLQVGELGGSVVGNRIDVVVLQTPAPAAVGTAPPVEQRGRAEIECGPKGGRDVAAEMLDGEDVDTGVKDRLEEGVLAQLTGHLNRNRAPIDDVADLAGMGVAATPRVEVAYDHQLCMHRWLRLPTRYQIGQCISRMGFERLDRLAAGSRVPSAPPGRQLDPPYQRQSGLRWEGTAEAHHPIAVPPVSEAPGREMLPS